MSKVVSKIGRTFDKVIKKTGVKKIYEKTVPSSIRRAVSKTWQKIRKPVLAAVAIYFTAGAAAAYIGGTSLAGGFATVNSGIASVFGGGAAAGGGTTLNAGMANASANIGASAGSGLGTTGTGLLQTGATSAATTGTTAVASTTASTGLSAGLTNAVGGNAFGLGTVNTAFAPVASTTTAAAKGSGFFASLQAGNYGQAAVTAGKNVWGAATQNAGSAMLASSVLQGVGANQQQKRQERLAQEARDRQSYYGMNNLGDQEDLSVGLLQAPTMVQSTSLDDLIRRRNEKSYA